MATTLQIVASDLTTVLFDLHDPTGANNADGVCTEVALGGGLGLGAGSPEPVMLSPASIDGGFVVSNRVGLGTASWRQKLQAASGATTPDSIINAVGTLAHLLDQGGILKYVANASAEVRYIDFEPSPAPALYQGQELELYKLTRLFQLPDGVTIQVIRQPFLRGAELSPALNLVTNPTLTQDFGGTANRPDDWTWTGTTGLSAETIAQVEVGGVRRGVYRFTKADGTAASLQLTTADNTYASGDVGVFSFYARVQAVAGTPQMQATLQFQTNAAANVGGLHSGGLVTLTTKWQRISVTSSAAGATTGQALVSIQIDNGDATSVVVEVCNAQAEKTALTPFRVPPVAVAYNPTSTALPRKVAVWGEGNAPSLAKLKATADSLTMGRYRVYRVAAKAVQVLQATLHKSLRSGTLGTDTTSAADADAVDGNVALVTYTEPDPSFGTDNATSGASTTVISLAPPASLAVGDCMVAVIGYWRNNAQITAPFGWQLLGQQTTLTGIVGTGSQAVMHAWIKIATADDIASATFDFDIIYSGSLGSGAQDYVVWIGRFPNIDQEDPLDTFQFNLEASGTAPTALSITTAANNAEIVTVYMGAVTIGSGTLTFTAPAGTTPTYAEQDDRQATSTWRAMAVYTGVLATAGATGNKDATASSAAECITLNLALRKAVAVTQARSTVTYLGTGTGALPAGEYDVWLRYRTTAACFDRLRVEYGLKASPTTWIALPDHLIDTRAAATFTEFEEHNMGRLAVPEDQPLDTLTVRVSAGRVVSSSANLKLDCIYLAPVFERAGFLSTDTILANGEHFYTVPAVGAAYHLASDSDQSETAEVDGPTPVELEPGFQVLIAWPALLPLTGYVDPPTEVTSSPTLAVTHAPRYRT
jgi:hypothetical protein